MKSKHSSNLATVRHGFVAGHCLVLAAALALLGAFNSVHAQQTTIYKTSTTTMNNATTDWSTTSGGVGNTAAGAGKIGVFDASSATAPSLGGSITLDQLVFGSTAGATTIGFTSGSTLTLGAASGSSGIDMSAAGNNVTFTNSVTFGNTNSVSIASGKTLVVGVCNSGDTITFSTGTTTTINGPGIFRLGDAGPAGGVTVTGGGNIIIANGATFWFGMGGGPSSYTGNVTMNSGVYKINGNTSLFTGAATLTLNGGNIGSSSASTRTVTAPVTIGGDFGIGDTTGSTGLGAFGGITFSTNANLNGGTRTITVATGVTGTFSSTSVISDGTGGSGGLTKAGPGTLTLTGTNTYTGNTTINAGTVIVNTPASSSGSRVGSAVVINGGTLRTDAANELGFTSGNVADLTVNGGGTFNNNGNNAYVNNLTLSNNATMTGAGFVGLMGGSLTQTGNGAIQATISASLKLADSSGAAKNATFTIAGDNPAGDLMVNGVVQGGGSLTKAGAGVLALSATNTYTGNTTVNAGTLALTNNGSLASSPNIIVGSGGTFDVSGLTTPLTLGGSQKLQAGATGGNTTGTLALGASGLNLSAGGLAFTALGSANTTAPLTLSGSAAMALNGAPVALTTTADLPINKYTLIASNGTATVTGIPGALTIGGAYVNSGKAASLSVTNGSLVLTIAPAVGTITASGTLSAVPATYGLPSASPTSFSLSAANLTPASGDLTVAPPSGYEVSLSSVSGYTTSLNVPYSGSALSATTVYVRLQAGDPYISPGPNYSGNITINGGGASSVTIATASSAVSRKNLTVTGVVAQGKVYDGTTNATVTGSLQPGEAFGSGSSGDGAPYAGDTLTLTASGYGFPQSTPGTGLAVAGGSFALGGSAAGNYTLTQPIGALSTTIYAAAVWINTDASASWTNAANWTNDLVGSGANVTADFSQVSMYQGETVTLDGARTIGNLLFDDQSGSFNTWTLTNGSGGPLTLATSSGASIFSNSVATTIGVTLAGTNSLTKAGAGMLTLSGGAAAYGVGNLTVSGGNLQVGTAEVNATIFDQSTARTITVSSGASLTFIYRNVFGTVGTVPTTKLVIDGGTVVNSSGTSGSVNVLQDLTLKNGAVLEATKPFLGFQTYQLQGTVTVAGTNASSITAVAGGITVGNATNNAGVTTFNVADVTGDANADLTISAPIVNSGNAGASVGGLTKTGLGTLLLSGTNTYTGATVVSNGTLLVNGSLAAGSAVTNASGTLGGYGTINGSVVCDGTLALGASIGTLTINGALTLGAGSTNTFRVNGTTPTNDVIVLGSTVAYGGTLHIVPSGTFTTGQTFTLFSGAGATTAGNFASIAGSPGSGLEFQFTNGVLSVASTGPSGPAKLTNSYNAGTLSLTWPAGQGWRLQMQTNSLTTGLSTNWIYITDGSACSTNITVDPTKPTVFYRLRNP